MKESFPERPPLFLDFMVPSGPEDFFSNLWIADPGMSSSNLAAISEALTRTENRTPRHTRRRRTYWRTDIESKYCRNGFGRTPMKQFRDLGRVSEGNRVETKGFSILQHWC